MYSFHNYLIFILAFTSINQQICLEQRQLGENKSDHLLSISRGQGSDPTAVPTVTVQPGLLAGDVVLQQEVILIHQLLQLSLVGQAAWVVILVPALCRVS